MFARSVSQPPFNGFLRRFPRNHGFCFYQYPRCSMVHLYGIFTNIYPINDPDVGEYSIHGASGYRAHVQAGSSHCTTWTSPPWALVVAWWPCSCWPTLPWPLPAFPLQPSPRGIPWANGWGSNRRTRRQNIGGMGCCFTWKSLPFSPERNTIQ